MMRGKPLGPMPPTGRQRRGSERGTTSPPEADPDSLLDKHGLAARLNVTVRTIENWQAEGLLPYLKIAYIVRFYWPEVLAHLNTHFRVDVNGKYRPKA